MLCKKDYIYPVVAVITTLSFLLLFIGVQSVFPFNKNDSDVEFITIEIIEGMGAQKIVDELHTQKIISSKLLFSFELWKSKRASIIQPGFYKIKSGSSYADIIEIITSETGGNTPGLDTITIMIPEGLTIEQTANRFALALGFNIDDFISLANNASYFSDKYPYLSNVYNNSLEGFLFPNTYEVVVGSSAEDIILMLLKEFDKQQKMVGVSEDLMLETITIASIIEREVRIPEERKLVSSVIQNRLNDGMPLQMCSTVAYVLKSNQFRLTNEDLKVDSPYNTYLNKGLPPGPISSFGFASLEAAVYPADTDYLYFVLKDRDGNHYFTSNYTDFLKEKNKSIDALGQ